MKPTIVDPKATTRAEAYKLWINGAHAKRFLARLQTNIDWIKTQ